MAQEETKRKGTDAKRERFASGADVLIDTLNTLAKATNKEVKARTPPRKAKARRAVPGQETRELTLPELGMQYLEKGKAVEIYCHKRHLFETVTIGQPRGGGDWPTSTTFEIYRTDQETGAGSTFVFPFHQAEYGEGWQMSPPMCRCADPLPMVARTTSKAGVNLNKSFWGSA